MRKLDDRVAAITGGTSGIGKSTAELFVKEGAQIVVSDIQDTQGQNLAKRLGDNATFVHADVRIEDDVKNMVGQAVETFSDSNAVFNALR